MTRPPMDTASTERPRWSRRQAIVVARELVEYLQPASERLVVAGSLRRGKVWVGDVEILYVPKTEVRPATGELFASGPVDVAAAVIAELEERGVLERRLDSRGRATYGPRNKLMRHTRSGMPVDLFSTTPEAWWNYLVCRTGPASSNIAIAEAAKGRGYRWNPYGTGFTRISDGEVFPMHSEEAVFDFVGLPYRPPRERDETS